MVAEGEWRRGGRNERIGGEERGKKKGVKSEQMMMGKREE